MHMRSIPLSQRKNNTLPYNSAFSHYSVIFQHTFFYHEILFWKYFYNVKQSLSCKYPLDI